tara:strand:- start:48 stop:1208 length:1161 start_codon:yes stop_codon:yes gene_type:complete
MASLIKHRNQYCSKIRKWNGVKEVVTKIPLRTNKKDVAVVRHHKVESSENHIKDGIIQKYQFKQYFKWLNDTGTSEISLLTLSEAVAQFIDAHKINVSISSIKRIKISLNNVIKSWKGNTPIKHINTNDVEQFKRDYNGIHKVAGINLNLRNIKTFLRWCVENNLIENMPKIKMLREPKKPPQYISEDNFGRLLELDTIDAFFKRAFVLYLTTGCRRSEIVEGTLDGKILIVPATLSKSRIERQITLNEVQVKIVKEIHKARDTHLLKGYNITSFKERFTKAFTRACDEINIESNKLHCLRHTFAVTQWIISKDIYEVKNLLGHTSVTTTERYAQFNIDRLAQDFPIAYKLRLEIEKVKENAIRTPLIRTPLKDIIELPSVDKAKA